MGAIGGGVATLLISDQIQHRRQIQHRLGPGDLQEQAHLSNTQWQAGVRIQAGDLIWRGQGTGSGRAQDPPLSGSSAAASEPGSDGPG